jgi:FKBP-type peptidyl-prolyl cis-trans isomerase
MRKHLEAQGEKCGLKRLLLYTEKTTGKDIKMKRFSIVVLLLFLFCFWGCMKSRTASVNSDKEKASYAIGQQLGKSMKAQGVEIDANALAHGISDVIENKKSLLSDQEMQQAMQKMNQALMEKQEKASKQILEANAKYLEENKKKNGIKATASGLQYEILKEGTGGIPKETDTVRVHYRGTLIDGSEFDSSYKREAPLEFPVARVIKGWTEALKMMKVGSKWKLYVPSELAYGAREHPGIPANSVLLFEVELLGIVK